MHASSLAKERINESKMHFTFIRKKSRVPYQVACTFVFVNDLIELQNVCHYRYVKVTKLTHKIVFVNLIYNES